MENLKNETNANINQELKKNILHKMIYVKKKESNLIKTILDENCLIAKNKKFIGEIKLELKSLINENEYLKRDLDLSKEIKFKVNENEKGLLNYLENLKLKHNSIIKIQENYKKIVEHLKSKEEMIIQQAEDKKEVINKIKVQKEEDIEKLKNKIKGQNFEIEKLVKEVNELEKSKDNLKRSIDEKEDQDKIIYCELENKFKLLRDRVEGRERSMMKEEYNVDITSHKHKQLYEDLQIELNEKIQKNSILQRKIEEYENLLQNDKMADQKRKSIKTDRRQSFTGK